MAIVGLGMDLTELERVASLLERYEYRFQELILTPLEREHVPTSKETRIAHVAARFAAKEAAVKALGTGFSAGITPQCLEIRKNDLGTPTLHLTGAALVRAETLGVRHIHLTLTHSRHTAGAVVILEQ